MENEARLSIKLPADLLEAVKIKADKNNLTVSALVRKFFLTYVTDESEPVKESSNAIYHYQDVAKRKRELKEAIKEAHKDFTTRKLFYADYFKKTGEEHDSVLMARHWWKDAIAEYRTFCNGCKQNKLN